MDPEKSEQYDEDGEEIRVCANCGIETGDEQGRLCEDCQDEADDEEE